MSDLLRIMFTDGMRRARTLAQAGLLVSLVASVVSTPLASQTEDAPASDRKVITRVEPKYPPTLERLYIGGVVRVQVDVAANGTVEGAQLIGGNPILGQSAIAAVKQWKYTPGKTRTKVVERLEFDPHR